MCFTSYNLFYGSHVPHSGAVMSSSQDMEQEGYYVFFLCVVMFSYGDARNERRLWKRPWMCVCVCVLGKQLLYRKSTECHLSKWMVAIHVNIDKDARWPITHRCCILELTPVCHTVVGLMRENKFHCLWKKKSTKTHCSYRLRECKACSCFLTVHCTEE